MAGKKWLEEEIAILKEHGPIRGCQYVADKTGRTIRSVRHKYGQLGLEKPRAKVGDVIKGWEILETYLVQNGNQQVRMAKIKSILGDGAIKKDRLTKLTNHQIGWPDRRRPDNIENNTTHGESKTRLYSILSGMKNRCLNKKQLAYKSYGGRGIKICKDWMKYENFRDWALNNGYDNALTIDRINVNGNYCPENCRWATIEQQAGNKRNSSKTVITAFNDTKSIYEWCNDDRCYIGTTALEYRINAGWEPEDAITRPSERKSKVKLEDWLRDEYPDVYDEYQAS